jgi:hypothetical protein
MEYGEAIIDAIEDCRIMVLVFTANANASPQIRREIERAVNHGVAILPLRVEDVLPGKALEYFIGNVHWLDALTPPFEAHLKNLAGTIKIVLARMEPGASPVLPQEERLPASGGHGAAQGAPKESGARETAPAPRDLSSARAWSGPAGGVAALLVAFFIWVHFTSHPAPVTSPQPAPVSAPVTPSPNAPGGPAPVTPAASPLPVPAPTQGASEPEKPGAAPHAVVPAASPAQTASHQATPPSEQAAPPLAAPPPAPEAVVDNAALLRDSMKTLQNELSGIGTVKITFDGYSRAVGSSSQVTRVDQISNVVADPAQCLVSFHWKVWRNGAATQDNDAFFLLRNVTSVIVEPESQNAVQLGAAAGHPDWVGVTTTPPVALLLVYEPGGVTLLPFTDAGIANRIAANITEAVKLCGGPIAN